MSRGADRLCSYGDWAALSDICDAATAAYLKDEVSDGIIAPGYTEEALRILKTKKKGNYNVVQIDPDYVPAAQECKDVFGVTFEQGHNNFTIDEKLLQNLVTENKELPEAAVRDMIVALITVFTAHASPGRRPITGCCVSTRRCSACSLSTASAARTGITPSMSICRMNTKMSSRTVSGRAYSG